MSEGGEEQLFVRIPSSLKYLVDEDDRTNKEIVIAALEAEFNVRSEDSIAVIDRQIARLEDELEDEKAKLDRRRDRLEDVQDKLQRARDIREEKVEQGETYEEALDALLARIENGDLQHVFPGHAALEDVRAEYDRPTEEIHLDLQQRAAERDADIPVACFKSYQSVTGDDWQTPITAEWGDRDA